MSKSLSMTSSVSLTLKIYILLLAEYIERVSSKFLQKIHLFRNTSWIFHSSDWL